MKIDLETNEYTLETIEDYAKAYRALDAQEKAAKKAKEDLRGPFFALMTQQVRQEEELQKEILEVPNEEVARFNNDPREWCLFYYPTYTVENLAFDGKIWKIVLQENPELKPLEFEVDGYKLGRSISLVGAEFKIDEFDRWIGSEEAEERFDEATLDALADCVIEVREPTYSFDEDTARDLIAEKPELIDVFQRFSYAGKPQVKFLPVTKAKTEEEETNE